MMSSNDVITKIFVNLRNTLHDEKQLVHKN